MMLKRNPHANTASRGRSQPQLHNNHPGSKDEQIDALLANFQGVLDCAQKALSAGPVPGVGNALDVLKVVTEKIVKMRANIQEKKDVVERIEQLLKLIESSLLDIASDMDDIPSDVRLRIQEDMKDSRVLRMRINGFLGMLEGILKSVEEPRHTKWYKKVWFANQDAEFLRGIRQKIIDAIKDFEIQGSVEIRDLFGQSLQKLKNLEQLKHDEADLKILAQLKPANASHKSALIEEKSHLQPGTREQILRDLVQWSTVDEPNTGVYILHGGAGIGKSSIAHALCRHLEAMQLGASFFFVRASGECDNAYSLFPTVAYQLAHSRPDLRPIIADAARKHLGGGQLQTMEYQLEGLIMDVLRQIVKPPSPLLLVVDGVDECSNKPENIVPDMLRLLCRVAEENPFLRILIATRPETYIMDVLLSPEYSNLVKCRDLQKEASVDEDIRFFIETEFKKAGGSRPFFLLSQRENAVTVLTRLADGLFIYASIVVRFLIHDKYHAVQIYDSLVESQGRLGPTRLYGRLDQLYRTILHMAFEECRDDQERIGYVHQLLCWVALYGTTDDDDWRGSVPTAESLAIAGIPSYITLDVISRLRSVLAVGEEVTTDTELRAPHASFPQFLTDNARCRDSLFYVNTPEGHALIAKSLLNVLIPVIFDSFRSAEGPLLAMWDYARLTWHSHLEKASCSEELRQTLLVFLKKYLEGQAERERSSTFGSGTRLGLSEGETTKVFERVCDWYKAQRSDEAIILILDNIINKETKA